jgi:hypothetical protein
MSFMQHQVYYTRWIEIDGPCGIDAVPFDVVFTHQGAKTFDVKFEDIKDYTENREAWSITIRDGYGARLSAPGYMDCTPWSVFNTEDEAIAYLNEYYPEDEENEEETA